MAGARHIPLYAATYTLVGTEPAATDRAGFAARLGAVKRAGMDGLTLHFNDPVFTALAPGEIAGLIADMDVTVPAIDFLSDWSGPPEDSLAQALRIAEIAGAPVIHLGLDLAGRCPPLADLAAPFRTLCARAADAGRRIALEPVAWGAVSSLDAALELIESAALFGPGLVLDVWHLASAAPLPLTRLAGLDHSLVSTVQISDALPMTHASPSAVIRATRDRLYPGDGALDIIGFLSALEPALTASGVTVEVFSPGIGARTLDQTADAAATAGKQMLERLDRCRDKDLSHG
ncbi:sugar phosphate isomerase/epimerase family protein [Oceanicola sp. S124]|uniref:sugar phosphate isomerase/epimerase family protein n=1 Tax=Oceanicola sp. S124 TaxID=1042378 RepID=UPI0002557D3F|nr:TIM barrel protein [Oceanicola sp. S124]